MSTSTRFGLTHSALDLKANPFTDSFVLEEVAFYDLPKPYSKNGVEVALIEPRGRLDDYLNKNWRIPNGLVPALGVDGSLWMSLAPMEIQSAYVPIAMARGIVGTAGLGLGYFPLRVAGDPGVEEVHVYEQNPRVISFFKETFNGRPEIQKITIHHGDVRELAMWNDRKKGPSFDFFFMDVYQTMLPDTVINDIALFQDSASVEEYRFWGQERVVLDAMLAKDHPKISFLEKTYFKAWWNTPLNEKDPAGGVLSDFYEPASDEQYRYDVLSSLELLL